MANFNIGDKVRMTAASESAYGMRLRSGKVVGFGHITRGEGMIPVVLVELPQGASISDEFTNTYVSIVSILPEYLELND